MARLRTADDVNVNHPFFLSYSGCDVRLKNINKSTSCASVDTSRCNVATSLIMELKMFIMHRLNVKSFFFWFVFYHF